MDLGDLVDNLLDLKIYYLPLQPYERNFAAFAGVVEVRDMLALS